MNNLTFSSKMNLWGNDSIDPIKESPSPVKKYLVSSFEKQKEQCEILINSINELYENVPHKELGDVKIYLFHVRHCLNNINV